MEVEAQTQPTAPTPSGSAVVDAFNRLAADLPADQSTTADPTPVVEAQPAPASITIPIERVPEKFRANPSALPDAYQNAERFGTQKAQEAAQLRRENEALQSRLSAAEQVNRMSQPQVQTAQPNLSEMVITETPKFVDNIVQQARTAAREAAAEESQKSANTFRQEQQSEKQARAFIDTFEAAKALARSEGYVVTDDEWRQMVGYIAPAVARENEQSPGILYNPRRYIDHLRVMKGAPPKATIPSEGNPPVATRAASAPAAGEVPTLSRENAQLDKLIRKALGENAQRQKDK